MESATRTHYLLTTAAALALAMPAALYAGETDSNTSDNQQQTEQRYDHSGPAQQANDQEQSQQNEQQSSNDNGNNRVSGTVLSYREINLDGTKHFRARLQGSNGGTVETVDFGPSRQISDLIDNIEQGDHISVNGQWQNIDGKNVFVASRARLMGQSYAISQSGESSETNSAREQNESEQNSRQANGEQNESQRQTGAEEQGSSRRQADEQEQANGESNRRQSSQPEILLSEGFVFVNEGDLNRHLMLAHEALAAGDAREAAGELRAAASRISLYADSSEANHDARQALQSSRKELDQLADQISSNKSNAREQQLCQAASRAQLALARFYDASTDRELGEHQPVVAGYDLQAAANHARDALLWSDETPPTHAIHSIHQAMRTADDLISGNQRQANGVTQVAQSLDREINQIDEQFGKQEQQAQPASASESASNADTH